MKNQLLNERVLNFKTLLCLLLLGLFFSVLMPGTGKAQTVITGQLFTYTDAYNEDDTTGLVGQDVYVKFYRLNGQNQLVFVKSAPVNTEGYFSVTVYTTNELYAIVMGDDTDAGNFVTTFYPGWLDFESAEPINDGARPGDTVDSDWGAVGKEIVERPSGPLSTVSGVISPYTVGKSDFVSNVYLFDELGNLMESVPVASDGSYSLGFSGNGKYELFTSVPGYTSQSQYITSSSNKKGDFNVNFNLEVYRGDNQTSPVNTVAEGYSLKQNYPNPFNPTTNINFTVPATGIVKLTVYNAQGKQVTQLVNDLVEAGSYDITFNGENLASGVYYYTLQVGNNVITKKMNLIK